MPQDIRGDRGEPLVVERYYDYALTGRSRVVRVLGQTLRRVVALLGLSLFFSPLLVLGLVTLDLPLRMLDGLVPLEAVAPSRFLSRGEGILGAALFVALLATRRWGSRRIGQTVLVSWLLTLAFAAMLVLDLAPELAAEDYPETRFITSVVLSWMAGHGAGVAVFDVTRGGNWWRAPFFGGLIGLGVQALIYFPAAYVGTSQPWLWWLAVSLFLALAGAAAFTLVYAGLRFIVPPRTGLGGR
ncbi:hypothetical protein [Parvularcula maris]|uniref:hypothetical protein n=1 Tax=Parvularcula maris TaxID=2965077 RepID=UPI0021154949|nr:hypothetical protein [Parvularcula maris]